MVKTQQRSLETIWVNEFFRHYGGSVRYEQKGLREWQVNHTDLLEVGRDGDVVFSNKCEGPGAFWTVAGTTDDGLFLLVTIHVVTEEHFVDVILVQRDWRSSNGGGDAA